MKKRGLLQVLHDRKQLQAGCPGYPLLTWHVQLVAATRLLYIMLLLPH